MINTMKKIILVFFTAIVGYAQNENSTQLTNELFPLDVFKISVLDNSLSKDLLMLGFDISTATQLSVHNTTGLNDYYINLGSQVTNPTQLSVSNQVTGLNDYYANERNTSYIRSKKITTNTPLRGVKVDSFNPYGASSFGDGVIMGTFGVLLKKIQK